MSTTSYIDLSTSAQTLTSPVSLGTSTSLHSAGGIHRLPDDCIFNVLEFTDNPAITSVCKNWRGYVKVLNKSSGDIFRRYLKDPKLSYVVNLFSSQTDYKEFLIVQNTRKYVFDRARAVGIKISNPSTKDLSALLHKIELWESDDLYWFFYTMVGTAFDSSFNNWYETLTEDQQDEITTIVEQPRDIPTTEIAQQIRNWMNGNSELLNRITRLGLGKTYLKVIPAEIGKLTKLKRLDLSHLTCSILPLEVALLPNLQETDYNNYIKNSEEFTRVYGENQRRLIKAAARK